MNGVIGMAELLCGMDLTPEQEDFAGTIRSSAESLLAIINDILDLSKIEAGKMTVEAVPFDLRGMAEEICGLFRPKAVQDGLQLVCAVDESVPTTLVGDPTRVRQILSNLISNALKFTEEGEVRVSVRSDVGKNGVARVWIDVSDTGVGIPPSVMQRSSRALPRPTAAPPGDSAARALG